MNTSLTVITTFGNDVIFNKSKEIVKKKLGGPAFYISKAIGDLGITTKVITGENIDVQILVDNDGEFGKIPFQPKSQLLPIKELSNWTIVSTLLREWDLSNCIDYKGKMFVDIQGYVRNGDDFGKKRVWTEVVEFANNIYCLKGTKEEVSYLPAEVLIDQKNRLLIATDGSRGLDLFYQGSNFYIPSNKVINPKDTIGAGDTFFGYFVASMYKGENPIEAAESAVKKTGDFLRTK